MDGIKDNMFYSFLEQAWHSLGFVSKVPTIAEEIVVKHFGGGYFVRLEPITMTYNGAPQETGDFGIIRGATWQDPEEVPFGYVTGRFNPIQLLDVARTFDSMVNKPVETFGVLNDGRLVFLTWKMPSFEVVGFEHLAYGAISVGLDNKNGGKLFTCNTRVVCWNTLSMAIGEAEGKKKTRKAGEEMNGMVYKSTKTNPNMLRNMGYWMKAIDQRAIHETSLMESLFKSFANKPIKSDAEAHEILYEAFPTSGQLGFYPAELRTKKEEAMAEADKVSEKIRTGIYELFAGAGIGITPDYYGMMNATTEFYCNKYASKKPIAESIMWGNRADAMANMVSVLRERL
jgi:hypothetical protein